MKQHALAFRALAGALFVGLIVSPLHAQRAHIGPHGGYSFDRNHGLIGGQLTFPIARQVELYPSFDYYFGSGPTVLGFSGDLKLRFPTGYGSDVYFGGGPHWLHTSITGASGTDMGWDVFFGLESRRGVTHPYIEGRVLNHSQSQFQLLGGLNITLF